MTLSTLCLQRLNSCDPRLIRIVTDAAKIVELTVVMGHRGQAEQDEAFRTGKSKLKWPYGNHNASPSRAVDLAPLYYDVGKIAKIDWNDVAAFGRMMGVVQAIAYQQGVKLRFGMDWDGDYRTVGRDPNEHFLDAPHVELVDP
jgi:hypothetical protein